MDIQQAIEDYITYHEVENSSAYTIVNHRKQLGYFSEWLASSHGVTDTDQIQLAHLRGWMSYLQKSPARYGKKRSDATVYRYGMSMLTFLHWLERE
jgi:site-specific recombinase XerD